MEWYNYIADFFAGAFLANFVPHFIYGVSGDKFPTPFAKRPGQGLSSALTNTLWGLLNLAIGFLLFVNGHISTEEPVTWILVFAGVSAMSIMLSINFQKKDKE